MKIQSINFTNKLAFGEVNQYGHRANTGSLNNPKETVNLGNPFKEDVFEYARRKAKLPKDFDLHSIINADDFGISPENNSAILEAAKFGILKSTSAMINTPYCDYDLINELFKWFFHYQS